MVEYCCFCGIDMRLLPDKVTYTKDHLVPKCKGGNDSVDNKKTCCSDCNSEKGSRTLKQYVILLKKELKRLENHSLNYSKSLKRLIYITELKILNAGYWIEYTERLGLKLYKNKNTFDQWNGQ